MPKDVINHIFGSNLDKDSLLSKLHPMTKIITMFFFPIVAFLFYSSNYIFVIFGIYFLLILLNKQNPFHPWILWIISVFLTFLIHKLFPNDIFFDSLNVLLLPKVYIVIFLVVAPFTQISKSLNPYSVLQVLPKSLNWIGIIIFTFVRYLVVVKEQFLITKKAFKYRNKSILFVLPQFATTWIHNSVSHSAKFADNIEIRGLDNPSSLYDRPSYTDNDAILFSIYVLIIIGGFFKIWLKQYVSERIYFRDLVIHIVDN